MKSAGLLVVVLVRIGLAAAAPRTAHERLLEAVERELHETPYRLGDGHKLLHRSHHSHRVRHQPRDALPTPEAEVRCYCSLPACLATGYMCQSMVGSCFSETVQTDRRVHTRHGCLELLSRHKQRICERLHSENKADLRLRCCTEDMCNIVDDGTVSLELGTRIARLRNSSLVPVPTPPAQLLNMAGGRLQTQQQQQQQEQRSGELWLRAATIAVPIAGLFILAGLVLMAVRMLRRDSKPQYQYAKAPLCLEQPALARASVGSAASAAGAGLGAGLGAGAGAGAGAVVRVGAAHRAPVPVHCVVAPADWRCDA